MIFFLAGAIPFRSAYTASLVTSEGITGVVALNEPYELNLCSYQKPGWQQLGVTISITQLANKKLSILKSSL